MASVDRQTLGELIEAQKAQLSPEALELWKELDESPFFSNEADHFINEDLTNEQADRFMRHQSHQLDILGRFDRMPEDDRRTKYALIELRAGMSKSDEAESRGEPAQPRRDKCVINAAIIKDRDKWGPGGSMRIEEFKGRTVEQALARLGERSQLEPPDERESPERVEEAPDRAEDPSDAGGAQEGVRSPWWRRVFGS